jgi:hypothetical protein
MTVLPAALLIVFLAALIHVVFRLHRFWDQMPSGGASSMLFTYRNKLNFVLFARKASMDLCLIQYW